LGRILQVRHKSDNRVAAGLKKGVERGSYMPEITSVYNHLDVLILLRDLLQDRNGSISRGVVDEDVLITITTHTDHRRPDPGVKLAYVVLLVVTGSNDADGSHQVSLRSMSRPYGTPYVTRSSTIWICCRCTIANSGLV